MHIIKPHQTAISLFSRDGLVRKFASKTEALNYLGYHWISSNVGRYFIEFHHVEYYGATPGNGERYYHQRHYIMRDDEGRPFEAGDFNDLVSSKGRGNQHRYAGYFWNGEGPVPRTGRRGNYRMFRHPGTQALRRNAAHCADEGEPAIRAKRNAAGVPTAWDDYRRMDVMDRSWKSNRKTQWKAHRGD